MDDKRFSDMTQEEYREYINSSAGGLRRAYAQFGATYGQAESMMPIIEMMAKDIRMKQEECITNAVHEVGVFVDKERLVQALTDARAFYDEGYRAGYHAARMAEVERDG